MSFSGQPQPTPPTVTETKQPESHPQQGHGPGGFSTAGDDAVGTVGGAGQAQTGFGAGFGTGVNGQMGIPDAGAGTSSMGFVFGGVGAAAGGGGSAFGGGFGPPQPHPTAQLSTPTHTAKQDAMKILESWHSPIEPNELLRLDQELFEEKKKWTRYNARHAHASDESTSDTSERTIRDATTRIPSASSMSATAATSSLTPTTMMDLDRIGEFRRLVVRMAATAKYTRLCFTPDMLQCISNLMDDYVQFILTDSSITNLSSSDQTGLGSSNYQIHYFHSFPSSEQLTKIGNKISRVRRMYAQQPTDSTNWSRSTHVTHNLVDRWYQRYQTVAPEPIPPALSEVERAALGALVEFLLTDLVDCLGVQSKFKEFHSVGVQLRSSHATFHWPTFVDLWLVLHSQSNLLAEISFRLARVQFDLSMNRPLEWVPLDQYTHRSPVTYEAAVKLDLPDSIDRMNQLNRSSWYMDPHKLLAYAQQFVRGQLIESDSIKKLRELGIRPLQFYISGIGRMATFELTDATGEQYRLMCCLTSTEATGTIAPQWIRSLVDGSSILHSNQFKEKFQFAMTPCDQRLLEQCERFNRELHTTTDLGAEEDKMADSPDGGWFKSPALAHPSPPSTQPITSIRPLVFESSMSEQKAKSALSDLQVAITLQFKRTQQLLKHKKFERLFAQMEPLTRFSLFGPTFYQENHPLEVKRLFHSHVMDTALIDSGMIPLPRVLNDLISQYACIEIPFIETEAYEQMRHFPPIDFEVTSDSLMMAGYPGCTKNPVETIPNWHRECGGYHWKSQVEFVSASSCWEDESDSTPTTELPPL